ncbi:MAG: hypothetical protein J5747_00290 [Spirochaetaceae bacterium]|nr:hypothetical protein [Spirochaetaceae bacterium]
MNTEHLLSRLKILQALELFQENLHEIIEILIHSNDTFDFREKVKIRFNINDEQAQVIADMQVKRFTVLQKQELLREIEEVKMRLGD